MPSRPRIPRVQPETAWAQVRSASICWLARLRLARPHAASELLHLQSIGLRGLPSLEISNINLNKKPPLGYLDLLRLHTCPTNIGLQRLGQRLGEESPTGPYLQGRHIHRGAALLKDDEQDHGRGGLKRRPLGSLADMRHLKHDPWTQG